MKNFAIFGASALMAGAALAGVAQCVVCNEWDGLKILTTEDFCEEERGEILPQSGMFFSSANVVEEYEYDDAYCIVYDDLDADLENVEICVDAMTYELIVSCTANDSVVTGNLIYNPTLSNPREGLNVYTYLPEEMVENSKY